MLKEIIYVSIVYLTPNRISVITYKRSQQQVGKANKYVAINAFDTVIASSVH